MEEGSFHCRRCGACCSVPGYVEIGVDEVLSISRFLGMEVHAFTDRYTVLTANRRHLSLTSRPDGRCIFLNEDKSCRIQPVKPRQCAGFPDRWREPLLLERCPAWKELRNPERSLDQGE